MDKVLLRVKDLKRYGVNNWVTLGRWIREAGAPPGFYLGPNTRAWYKEDWDNWLANRPSAAPPENVKGDGPAPTGTAARKPKPPSSPTNIGESAPACNASSNGARHG